MKPVSTALATQADQACRDAGGIPDDSGFRCCPASWYDFPHLRSSVPFLRVVYILNLHPHQWFLRRRELCFADERIGLLHRWHRRDRLQLWCTSVSSQQFRRGVIPTSSPTSWYWIERFRRRRNTRRRGSSGGSSGVGMWCTFDTRIVQIRSAMYMG
jgi:hypothetical protein